MSLLRLLALALLSIATLGGRCVPPIGSSLCVTPLAADEPLCNPSDVESIWTTSHRGSYAQASSPAPGPVPGVPVTAEHVVVPGTPIVLGFSKPYASGEVAVWGTPLGLNGEVIKLSHDPFEIVDVYVPAEREPAPPTYTLGISGAYNAVDRDGRLIVGRTRFIEVYEDAVPSDPASPIALNKREFLPDSFFCRASDVVAGMVLTYDDHLAFVTEQSVLGVIPRDPALMTADRLVSASLNGDDCGDAAVDDADLETVSNSIAADENGGIYVVTSDAMYKFHFDGTTLSQVWRAEYEAGDDQASIRLGRGSGSTPSLMGTRAGDDRFVVITDGQDLMHVVLMWRDEIPEDWEPIAPGKDRRIACENPVTFGDSTATTSLSEQSVLVRGYSTVVVNNQLADDSIFDGLPAILRNLFAAFEGGNPDQAPRGLERIDWDPESRTCRSVWANATVSIPNGIPTMSQASGMIYGIGLQDALFGLEGIDFETGASALFVPGDATVCPQQVFDNMSPVIAALVGPVLERLPQSCENSFYAGTTVGPDGAIYTGTWAGVSKYTPATTTPAPPLDRADAGLDQGSELVERALAELPGDAARAAHWSARGALQLNATVAAFRTAIAEGDGGILRLWQTGLADHSRRELQRARGLLEAPDATPSELDRAERILERVSLRLALAGRL